MLQTTTTQNGLRITYDPANLPATKGLRNLIAGKPAEKETDKTETGPSVATAIKVMRHVRHIVATNAGIACSATMFKGHSTNHRRTIWGY